MKRGYGQFCPVAVPLEIFAERWAPVLHRSLFMGADRFNELHRGVPLISRPLLAKRLRNLEKAGVITMAPVSTGRGYCYRLTQAGEEFRTIIEGLGEYGQWWAVGGKHHHPGARLLIWSLSPPLPVHCPPPTRTVG